MDGKNAIYTGGFAEPVYAAQAAFRAVMDAMARPGSIHRLEAAASPPLPMNAAAGAIALTLCDHDTPVYLSKSLVEAGLPGWLAFQTGALVTEDRDEAMFAFLDLDSPLPPLSTFASGTQEYPDRSTTIVFELPALDGGEEYLLSGPGIDGTASMAPRGLPASFEDMWRANHALYPRGVDLVLVAGQDMLCLPRTVNIRKKGH